MTLVPRSAAYRIALSCALAFALASVLTGAVVYLVAHRAIERQLDASITQASLALVGEYRDDGRDGLVEAIALREGSAANALGYAVFDAAGQRVLGSLDTAMPLPGWHRIIFNDPTEGADPARALVTQLAPGLRLVVAADLEPVEAIDRTILVAFAAGLGAIVVIGALIAAILGRYLRLRLDRIAQASHGFAHGDLHLRAVVGPADDEFDRLAASLNAMLDRITALLRNLQQVSSDLAHDMRTPLTHLRADLERLRDDKGGGPDAIEAIIERTDEILSLFSTMLRISEVEHANLRRHFREMDLAALTRDIVETHEPLAEESGHVLRFRSTEEPLPIVGDRELLAQALINLIQNALRHTPGGTRIEVGTRQEAGQTVLFVRDDGPGIAPGDRVRVLERFVRLESARSSPGHGLGLSLVRAIAEAHEARLELRDAAPGLEIRLTFAVPS